MKPLDEKMLKANEDQVKKLDKINRGIEAMGRGAISLDAGGLA